MFRRCPQTRFLIPLICGLITLNCRARNSQDSGNLLANSSQSGNVKVTTKSTLPPAYLKMLNLFVSKIQPAIGSNHLDIDINNESDTEEGRAYRQDAKNWTIEIYGGFINQPETTPDVFLLVLCHELGHLLGGQPTRYLTYMERAISNSVSGRSNNISTEGQADYYAAQRCMKIILQNENNSNYLSKDAKVPNVKQCASPLCNRIVAAGFKLLSMIGNEDISVTKSDNTKVVGTLLAPGVKPSLQCRLDTFIAGAACDVKGGLIGNITNPFDGVCRTGPGARPACWFNANHY